MTGMKNWKCLQEAAQPIHMNKQIPVSDSDAAFVVFSFSSPLAKNIIQQAKLQQSLKGQKTVS